MSKIPKAQICEVYCVCMKKAKPPLVCVGLLLGMATENSRRRRRDWARARRSHDEHCPRAWWAASRCPVHGAQCMLHCLHYTISQVAVYRHLTRHELHCLHNYEYKPLQLSSIFTSRDTQHIIRIIDLYCTLSSTTILKKGQVLLRHW